LITNTFLHIFILYKSTVSFGNFFLGDFHSCIDTFLVSDEYSVLPHQTVSGKIIAPNETWYHLAAVYQHTTASIYVNGTLSGSRSNMSPSSAVSPVSQPKYIGGNNFLSSIMLDEIKLYNKALTRDQLILDMNVGEDMASGIC
jgi:hypothetical protein